MFTTPAFMITDPALIKDVLINNFTKFPDRNILLTKNKTARMNVFLSTGKFWKISRRNMSHVLTPSKLHDMIPVLQKCSEYITKELDDSVKNKTQIELGDFFDHQTLMFIGSYSFGFDLMETEKFEKLGQAYHRLSNLNMQDQLRILAHQLVNPNILNLLNIDCFSPTVLKPLLKLVNDLTQPSEFNHEISFNLLNEFVNLNREELNNTSLKNYSDKSNFLLADMWGLYLGGYEPVVHVLIYLMYELSDNEDVQDKAREEIKMVLDKNNNEINLNMLSEMKYVDCVIKETLRKFPPAQFLSRTSSEEYKVPGTDFVLPKDSAVVIPIIGLHYDSNYFKNPDKFDPDRFVNDEIEPFTFLPFSEGQRKCVGLKLAYILIKLKLIGTILHHRFRIDRQRSELPLKYRTDTITNTIKSKIYVDVFPV